MGAIFRIKGWDVIPVRDWREARLYEEPDLLNAPYLSIYGHRARIEFLVLHQGRQILIEAERQKTPGSTDEELPYVFANAEINIKQGREFLLVMDGDGWKSGALKWVYTKADQTDGFTVIELGEFDDWLRRLSADPSSR